jgi:RimJ/RimL family protein N-acetyltransferase
MMAITALVPREIQYADDRISLIIRPLRKEDAFMLHMAVQESIANLLPFMDWAHGELNEENQLNRIVASNQNYSQGLEYDFAVFDTSGNFLVSASLHPSKTRNKHCFEIGYWTHIKHCNKGLST